MKRTYHLLKSAGVAFAALVSLQFGKVSECADLTYYVAPTALGDGSGSSAANAALYTNLGFWGNVQTSLSSDAATVRWLDGQYNSAGLLLRAMGDPNHKLTLTGDTVAGAVLNAAVPTMLEIDGGQNMLIKDLHFTAGPTSYQMIVASLNPGPWATWLLNPSHKIVIDSVTFDSATNSTGALGVVNAAYDVSVRNSTFSNAPVGSNLHMIYNAYETSHVSLYNNSFTNCPGDYVRYRDHADYGTIIGNTFKATDAAHAIPFLTMPNFNDVDPNNNPDNLPMELFATHYVIANNNFIYQVTSGTQSINRTPVEFYNSGYEPPGTDYLPTAADGVILTNTAASNTAAKKVLLNTGIGVSTDNTGMGIDTDEVHYYNNNVTNAPRKVLYSAGTHYGSVSQGWTGVADISATINTTAPNTTPGSTRVNWTFGSGEGWTNNSTASLQSAGWQFRAGTNANVNSYVNTTQTIGGATGVLYLGDSISSDALTADYKFQRLVTGSMQWRMGMTGAGTSFGLDEGHVNEGGLSLLGIELVDSHTLRILNNPSAATQDESFSSVDFGTVLDWRLDWTSDPDGVNGLASLWIRDSSGAVYNVYANRAYDSNIVPDTVWFDTSSNTGVSNSIFLDSLTVTVTAITTLPGDFNKNGIVDAADYITWRNGGANYTQTDHANWRSHFGQTVFDLASGSSLGLAAVPEASSLALLLSCGLVLLTTRHCRSNGL